MQLGSRYYESILELFCSCQNQDGFDFHVELFCISGVSIFQFFWMCVQRQRNLYLILYYNIKITSQVWRCTLLLYVSSLTSLTMHEFLQIIEENPFCNDKMEEATLFCYIIYNIQLAKNKHMFQDIKHRVRLIFLKASTQLHDFLQELTSNDYLTIWVIHGSPFAKASPRLIIGLLFDCSLSWT